MATKSITKQFVVNDIEMYKKIEKELEQKPLDTMKKKDFSNIYRGKEKLKKFSFR